MKYWVIWFVMTIGIGVGLGWSFPRTDSSSTQAAIFLPGQTSHGHYQIEMKCSVCHSIGAEVRNDACTQCHGQDLKLANDTHPASKFNDPTKADLLTRINAQSCITCHKEHVPKQTHPMGVTVPQDFCVYCHENIGKDRPSHKTFQFDSCLTAGCHNYHDNGALYEKFLLNHQLDPDIIPNGKVLTRPQPLAIKDISVDYIVQAQATLAPQLVSDAITKHWSQSAHALANVQCASCHAPEMKGATSGTNWVNQPDHVSCQGCHQNEVKGFLEGHHGMRLAIGLSPMQPAWARLPMQASSKHETLTCSSCHDPHTVETKTAAVESCLKCHNDQHSLNYKKSIHYELWQQELKGDKPAGSGVSCATCHMPRHEVDGKVLVEHNQNANLRPNEKMIKNVCLKCHGLAFNLDTMSDLELVNSCFQGRPDKHVPSIDMAKEWFDRKKPRK